MILVFKPCDFRPCNDNYLSLIHFVHFTALYKLQIACTVQYSAQCTVHYEKINALYNLICLFLIPINKAADCTFLKIK